MIFRHQRRSLPFFPHTCFLERAFLCIGVAVLGYIGAELMYSFLHDLIACKIGARPRRSGTNATQEGNCDEAGEFHVDKDTGLITASRGPLPEVVPPNVRIKASTL
jgi:hypothetical protein